MRFVGPVRLSCTWDTETAELLEGPHRFTSYESWGLARCSLDGTRVVTWHKIKAELWHVKSSQRLALCDTGPCRIMSGVSFSQDGSRFTTYTTGRNSREAANVWDGYSGAHVAGPFEVEVSGLSPDGAYLCGRFNRSSWLIHVDTGESVDMMTGSPDSIIFTPDGLHVAIKSGCTVDIFDTHSQKVNSFELRHPSLYISYLEYSSHGWLLLSTEYPGKKEGFHIWRVHIDHPPYAVNQDGWVLDHQQRPLVWVPTDIRDNFPGCDGVFISDEVLQSVDYGGMLVGDDWSRCYIRDS